jgi:rhodanese-related sulfurtransferase
MTMTVTLPIPDSIQTCDLEQLLVDDPQLRVLDVRTGGEFAAVHIPGAYNIPLDTLLEHTRDLADLDHPVVLVCQSGTRARRAQEQLVAAGKQGLQMLDGGMNAWTAVGGDVVHGDSGKWAMDRQVRFTAGLISLVAILTSVFVPKVKWLAGGVAGGLVFSAVTDTCAMGSALAKLPYNRADGCDVVSVLDEMKQVA